MRLNRNFKLKPSRKIKYLAAVILAAVYVIGFAIKAYSPAHLGFYTVPLPVLTRTVTENDSKDRQAVAENRINSRPDSANPSFSHLAVITTYFWTGELANSDNGYIANNASAWDGAWQADYGGPDSPSPRSGYYPARFTPKQNPFYFALPYNDLDNRGQRKPTAKNCPLAVSNSNYSWCKNSWIAIRHNGKIAYAQWEDVGPFGENDPDYVFGEAAVKNKQGAKAGLDVSPAVKDFLGLSDVDKADWAFVGAASVAAGPWRTIVTTDAGDSVD